jgi:hypothetical protein
MVFLDPLLLNPILILIIIVEAVLRGLRIGSFKGEDLIALALHRNQKGREIKV